jgi:cytosine/adenosine deaminase-related metal-dependent hydrolase
VRLNVRTLIQGGYIVGFNGTTHEILKDGLVVVEDDRIAAVGFSHPGPVDRTLDARGKLVAPGFINSHIHGNANAGDYFRNDPGKTDYFGSNYQTHFTPREGAKGPRSLEDFRVSGKFALVQAIKNGSTTIMIYGGGAEGDAFVTMVGELGVRAYMAPGFRSTSFYYEKTGALRYVWDNEAGERGLERARAFIDKHRGSYAGRIQGMLYPHGVDTCTPELLRRTKAVARELGVGIQIHCAMNLIEFHEILTRYGKTPIAFLETLGFLGPEVIQRGHAGRSPRSGSRGPRTALRGRQGRSLHRRPLDGIRLCV